jgi:hypothetical protein
MGNSPSGLSKQELKQLAAQTKCMSSYNRLLVSAIHSFSFFYAVSVGVCDKIFAFILSFCPQLVTKSLNNFGWVSSKQVRLL